MLSINQQGGAFQNIPQAHGESGLHHIMAGEVSIPTNYTATQGLPQGFARISPYPFPCNETLFDLRGPSHMCVSYLKLSLTSM